MIWIIFYTVILLFLYRDEAAGQCLLALKQWYETMIPALFPMMLMSNILVDTGFAAKLGKVCRKTVLRFLPISDNACYCLLAGFLCGFPMGAKTTSDMFAKGQIDRREASWLLSFVNCIGPLYTIHVTHVLFPDYSLWKLLIGLYALPLLYGIFLFYGTQLVKSSKSNHLKQNRLKDSQASLQQHTLMQSQSDPHVSFWDALYESVHKSGRSILLLGGFMILFQTFFVTLDKLLKSISITSPLLYPLVEITGGLFLQPSDTSLPYILFCNTWGGACCMLQTYSFVKPVGLSMKTYVFHKTVLALLSYLVGILLHQI